MPSSCDDGIFVLLIFCGEDGSPGWPRYRSGSPLPAPHSPASARPCRCGTPAPPPASSGHKDTGDAPPAHAASSAFPASGHSGGAARVSLRGTPPLGIAQIRLMNRVMVRLFKKSANRLPTSGTIRYALMEGAYFSQTTCMLAMALGVAPIPKPQVPDTSTAAS